MKLLLRLEDSEGMEWTCVVETDGLLTRRGEITPKSAWLQERIRLEPVINSFSVIREEYVEFDG